MVEGLFAVLGLLFMAMAYCIARVFVLYKDTHPLLSSTGLGMSIYIGGFGAALVVYMAIVGIE